MAFQDCLGGNSSFPSTWDRVLEKRDVSTKTKTIKDKDAETQTTIPIDSETQSDIISISEVGSKTEDITEIRHFLSRVEQVLLKELSKKSISIFDDYDLLENKVEDNCSKLFSLSFDYLSYYGKMDGNSKMHCTGISWNSTGSKIAVSYGRFDHSGWCSYSSVLCLWNIFHKQFNPKKPQYIFETTSGLMCCAFHPINPAVVAAGSFNGEIFVWNTALEEPLIASSKMCELSHREPVYKVNWMYDLEEKEYQIISTGGDGKVLFWSLKNNFQYPMQGFFLHTLKKKNTDRTGKQFPVLGGVASCLRQSEKSSKSFVVGSEGGSLYRCFAKRECVSLKSEVAGSVKLSSAVKKFMDRLPKDLNTRLHSHINGYAKQRGVTDFNMDALDKSKPASNIIYPTALDFEYETHNGPVYDLDYSPFHRSLFLSCSADGQARLYSLLQKSPLITIEPSCGYLFSIAWSKSRPLVVATAGESGEIHVFDLRVSHIQPVEILNDSNEITPPKEIYCLEFNPRQRNFLASGDSEGNVQIWKLNWQLSNMQPHEMKDMTRIFDKYVVAGDTEI